MAAGRRSVSDFSLGWLTLPKASPLQVIDAAASAGFGGVSLRVAGRAAEEDPGLVADPRILREVEAALADTGVKLLHMGGLWLDGTRPVASFEEALAAGARLGATMCVAIATPDRSFAQVLEDYSQLCRMAAAYRMRVAVEFAAYTGVRTLADANALLDRCGEPNAGLLVDALHLFRSGGTVAGVAALPPGRVFFAQLCDGAQDAPERNRLQTEARGNRLDLGQGELPIRALLQALPGTTPLEIEAPCLAYRNMGPRERARLAADAVRAFFATDVTSAINVE